MTPGAFLDNIGQFLALIALTLLSGAISAGETALFALTRQQLNRFRQSDNASAQRIVRFREHPSNLLSTVLLWNIAVNVLLYSMLGITVHRLAPDSHLWTAILGTVGFVLVLFGAEIIPKLVAFAVSERFAPIAAPMLRVLEVLSSPIRRLLNLSLVEPLTRLLSVPPAPPVTADELRRLIDAGRKEDLIDPRENLLLHQLMELSELRVSALMTPRVDVVAFDLDAPPSKLRELIRSSRLLRIPVYQGDIDNIRGIVSAKEFLLHSDRPIRELVRPVHFIPEQAGVEALLKHFRESGSQLALVVDEYGGLAGVVALEDVVEAIVGELRAPEERKTVPALQQIDALTYLVDAGIDVNDFCRAFDLPIEESRIHTLAGLIAEKLDRIPQTRDQIVIGHATLTIVRMRRKRILLVRVKLDNPPAPNPDLTILLGRPPLPEHQPTRTPTDAPSPGDPPA